MFRKDSPQHEQETELANYRRQIDAIDDRLVQLLIERIGIVEQVGAFKRRTTPGRCPLRPGREADMVRRVIKLFAGSSFHPAAAAAIWRIIIGMSTATEASMTLSVYGPDREHDLFWLAREYFGSFIPVIKQPHVKRVIGDIRDDKANVGIVPMLRGSDTTYWWTNLMEPGSDIKIFARIPFVYPETPGRDTISALAIGRIAPEPSGDDCSLLVIEAEHNVSQNRMQTAFTAARMEASWINIATLSTVTRHHLIELRGFVTPEHAGLQALRNALGHAIVKISFLGAYAVPVMLGKPTLHSSEPLRQARHAVATTKA
jgi:chorismate mutase